MIREKISRNKDSKDYQNTPQSIGAMAKNFDNGFLMPFHSHNRHQFLYSTSGVMRARTEQSSWIVPADRGLYIPANIEHSIIMHGKVEMRMLFIEPNSAPELPKKLCVLSVSNLLKELILALSAEPAVYVESDHGGAIAHLIEFELGRAREMPLYIPLPRDSRLKRLCAGILADPASRWTFDDWSQMAGGSTRTMARLFNKEIGMSFNSWRQKVRFHNALEALSRGEPVSVIAQDNGYLSSSAFSAAFRKVIGFRPSEFLESGIDSQMGKENFLKEDGSLK